jgi:hypothetical protein
MKVTITDKEYDELMRIKREHETMANALIHVGMYYNKLELEIKRHNILFNDYDLNTLKYVYAELNNVFLEAINHDKTELQQDGSRK